MTQNSIRTQTFLEFLPISIFGAVMALCGLCFSWRLAQKMWTLSYVVSEIIGSVAILSFITLSCAYVAKYCMYPQIVKREFLNNSSVCFFATFIISLLLASGIILPYFRHIAIFIWILGAALMFFFAWYILRRWIDNEQLFDDALPAWLMPVVGTLNVPIVGMLLKIEGLREICFLFFAIGMVFTFILFPIIFSRIFFRSSLSVLVQPTFLILTAPFSLAFSAYDALIGKQDMIMSVFFNFNIFLFIILVSKIMLMKICPFHVSWWSISFPLVAITISIFHYAEHQPTLIHQVFAGILLIASTLIIAYLFIQTIHLILAGDFKRDIS